MFKQSYISTPRTLSEAVFHADADPIERPTSQPMHPADVVMCFVIAPIVLVGVLALFAGWLQ